MASLAEIRARLAEQENRAQNKGSGAQADNAIYPFWNMADGSTATVRYVPDQDPDNIWGFWVERNIIKLPFNGIKGKAEQKKLTVQVPCIDMFGEKCPILAEVRPWYKDESLKDIANSYWKKRSYLMQGFVRVNPLSDDVTPANPIRRFIVSSQLFPLVKAVLTDPEVEELPTDYNKGLDFNIRKTLNKGGFAEYTTSSWARKESSLTDLELEAIETHGLFNLKEFLPKKPSEAELRIMMEMFEASVDGRPYDPDKWGAYYKPYGLDIPTPTATSSNVVETTTDDSKPETPPWEENDNTVAESPVVAPSVTPSQASPADIIAMIRSRKT